MARPVGGGGSPPAESTTWDPENKGADMVLSNGNLTATLESGVENIVLSTTAYNSGKRAIKAIAVYVGDNADGPSIGIVDSNFVAVGANGGELSIAGAIRIYWNGTDGVTDFGLATASGEPMYGYVDFDEGKVWFDNESDAYAADREAGTNPHGTFTPGGSFVICGTALDDGEGNDGVITLDPTYSSGSFAAWND